MAGDDETELGTLLQAVLESSPEVIVFALDHEYRYLAFNERHRAAMEAIWGERITVGRNMLEVISDPGDREKARFGFDRALSGESFVVEDEYGDTELQRLFWQNFMAPIKSRDGTVIGLTVFVLNITERRQAEHALALREQEFRTLVENSSDWVARYDVNLRRQYVNPAYAEAVPGGLEALLGTTPAQCPGGSAAVQFEQELREVFRTGLPQETELLWSPEPGREICTLTSMTPEFDEDRSVVSILTVGRDVTELYASRAKIHQMAFYDPLTGLPNRALFNDRLRQMVADTEWHRKTSALMMIDMDRFKFVNDSLGHGAGDELLCEVARRLTSCVRPYDTVARLGGDEFTILLSDIRDSKDLGRIADKLLNEFSRSFRLEGTEVFSSCSIGIALYPQDSTEAEDLMKFADSAMYQAKRSGRNAFRYYSPELTDHAQERLSLEVDLRRALERGELSLQFQPQVEIESGLVVGSEALLRWNHAVHGTVAPSSFLPIAEDTGLILKFGLWVLAESCRAAVRRNGPGKPVHKVSVNVSARQFQSMHFVDDVAECLASTSCEPNWIEFDIGERLLLDTAAAPAAALAALQEMGISIAIDDFGSGYSALSHLMKSRLNTLKIDPTFVHEASFDPQRAGLLGAVMSIADCLGMKVIAEGVETPEQAAVLLAQGCRFAQGFWYSHPVDPEVFDSLPANLPSREP